MDGRNPFRTTLKPWLKPDRLLVFARESSFQGFLGGAGFRPSTVALLFSLVLRCGPLPVWAQTFFQAAELTFPEAANSGRPSKRYAPSRLTFSESIE